MEIRDRTVLILGGSGLVGTAIARQLLVRGPARVVIGGLTEEEAKGAVAALAPEAAAASVQLVAEWGDVFAREEHRHRARSELLGDAELRGQLLEDLYGPLDEQSFSRSALVTMLLRQRPEIVVDCINTATAIAYQDVFASALELRDKAASGSGVELADVEAHLSTLYLPQLIRHVQLLLEGLRRAGTRSYVKIGTSGTGGMGLNVPFTHSEERPSRTLLAKSSLAGAHSLLLFLMGRTPTAPAVTEIKPAAAIAWKRIAYGRVMERGEPIPRVDCTTPVPLDSAFADSGQPVWSDTGEVIESVFLDAGENGMFSLCEFETISAPRMMEFVTPQEIAAVVIDEIEGRPTGHDVVSAIDGAVFGPTYRAGVLRGAALDCMGRLEAEHGVRSIAFEMLGPPRLSKLLFEATLLERLYPNLRAVEELDPEDAAARAEAYLEEDARLRSDMLSVGIPVLLSDGRRMLRGPRVNVRPRPGVGVDAELARRGWVDLRPESWVQWRERCARLREVCRDAVGPVGGSTDDLDLSVASDSIRPGVLAAFVLREEDGGERTKR
ncbi:MAG: short-chain dehydrogenase [Gemmatimonadota bacterium]